MSTSPSHVRCPPPEPVPGETTEATLARYQQAFAELAQCLDDELTIRPESSLLSRVVIKILVPFVALSAAISTFYASAIGWAKGTFSYSEYVLGIAHLLLAIGLLVCWLVLRRSNRFPRLRRLRTRIQAYLEAKVPKRTETLTRNSVVNRWIVFWFIFGFVFFVPFVFFLFRADAFDRLGMGMVVDTAGLCNSGADGFGLYRGSHTCASIAGASSNLTPAQANAAEIRLDATTTLTLYMVVLIAGIALSMVAWWSDSRAHRQRADADGGGRLAHPEQGTPLP